MYVVSRNTVSVAVNDTSCTCAVYIKGFAEEETSLVKDVDVLFNNLTAGGFHTSPPFNTGDAAEPCAGNKTYFFILDIVLLSWKPVAVMRSFFFIISPMDSAVFISSAIGFSTRNGMPLSITAGSISPC